MEIVAVELNIIVWGKWESGSFAIREAVVMTERIRGRMLCGPIIGGRGKIQCLRPEIRCKGRRST